ENAILANQKKLKELLPLASFQSLSYPISNPRPQTKKRSSKYFACCRGGGQRFNIGEIDLNYLGAYFLEQNRENAQSIKNTIDENSQANGWLIFATHDISDRPTRWGCTPKLFDDIVRYSVKSGARVLPVYKAHAYLRNALRSST